MIKITGYEVCFINPNNNVVNLHDYGSRNDYFYSAYTVLKTKELINMFSLICAISVNCIIEFDQNTHSVL